MTDEKLKELIFTVVGYDSDENVTKQCDGTKGSEGLYAALSEAGAFEIAIN